MVSPGCGIAGLVIVVVLISMLRTQLFGEFFLLALTLIALSVIGFLWGCIRLFTSTTRTQRMMSLQGIILNVMLWPPHQAAKTSKRQCSKVAFSASVSGTKESVSRSAQYSSAHGSSIGCERFQRM